MSRRSRSQAGQAAAEYVGILLIVALVIAALASGGLGGQIADGVRSAVCEIAGAGCAPVPAAPSERAAAGTARGDADGDGASDARERALGLDPHTADADGDGLPDGDELRRGTDPRGSDTDADGLPDAEEVDAGGALDPRKADSEDDGLTDAEELAAGTDPAEADGDGAGGQRGDGLTDAEEVEHGTDPNAFDTDGDGYSDGYEVDHGRDPTRDERNVVEKAFDAFLDDPFTLGKGTLIKGGAKKVVDDLLAKGGAAARRIANAKTIKEAARIRRERIAALRVRLRGTPQGMSRREFEDLGATLRSRAAGFGDDIRVHGSRASGKARPDSDVDIAIRVPADRFDAILRERFKTPNPGSAKERTMQHASQVGKIQSGELGLGGLTRELRQRHGKPVQISVIRVGGTFDRGPWVPVP